MKESSRVGLMAGPAFIEEDSFGFLLVLEESESEVHCLLEAVLCVKVGNQVIIDLRSIHLSLTR